MSFRTVILGSMDTRQQKEMLGRKKLVTRLSRSRVTDVESARGSIRFKYDGEYHTFKVNIKHHVRWVGHWDKSNIFLDNDVRYTKDQMCMAIHEAIESYVARKYPLDRDYLAHIVATEVEEQFAKSIKQDWDDYQLRTELIYRRESNARKSK